MISLLCPTRQRPEGLLRLYESAMEQATVPEDVEVVAVGDRDDDSYRSLDRPRLQFISTHRQTLSNYWNIACEGAEGPVYGLVADDVVFRTHGWDQLVLDAFPPDGIAYVFGDDGTPYWTNHDFGTHGFIREEWIRATGQFTTPDYVKDFADAWLNDIAKAVGRHVYIPILVEHLHWSLTGKRYDQNTLDLVARGEVTDVAALYASPEQVAMREADAAKLRAVMSFLDP